MADQLIDVTPTCDGCGRGLHVAQATGRALADLLIAALSHESSDVIGVAIVASGGGARAIAQLAQTLRSDVPEPAALPADDPPSQWRWDELNERERAIAELASQALTNRQIAKRLFISPHTVNYHLRHIFQKLDINSRVQLARYPRPADPAPPGS